VFVRLTFESLVEEFFLHVKVADRPSLRPLVRAYLHQYMITNPIQIQDPRVKVEWSVFPSSIKDLPRGEPLPNQDECSVCLESDKESFTLVCKHKFSIDCVEQLLSSSNYKCPLCRGVYLDFRVFWGLIPSPPKCQNCDFRSYNLLFDLCSSCMLVELIQYFGEHDSH
jgi:hypothetical protein